MFYVFYWEIIFLFSRSLIAVLRSAGDYKKSNHAEEEHYIISKALQVSNQQYVDAKRKQISHSIAFLRLTLLYPILYLVERIKLLVCVK